MIVCKPATVRGRRRRSALVAASLACSVALPAGAQDLAPKAPPQPGPVAILHATIHPVSGPVIEHGAILFDKGRITAVSDAEVRLDSSVRVIDAAGKHVYPGLIGAVTQMGLTEIGMVKASHDFNEVGSVSPEVRAAVAVNPDSTLIPVTRSNGVLTCGVFPTGGAIPGRVGVIAMEGWTSEAMTVKGDAGLCVNWPLARPVAAWWMDKSEEDQLKDIRKSMKAIDEAFAAAQAYAAARPGPVGAAGRPSDGRPSDLRWEAMRGVLPGPGGAVGGAGTGTGGAKGATDQDAAGDANPAQLPVFLEAQDYDQIVSAVRFAAARGLRAVLVGGRDAPLCAELLKKHRVGVIVQGTFAFPKRDDSAYDEPFTLPARLAAAGVPFAIASGQETPHERSLSYVAAQAVAYGLDHDAALRAITLSAAELLGVGGELGSLEPGKRATLLITDGDPMEMTTHITGAFIDGREIDLSNKQTALEKKYREKYRQGASRAAPGPGEPAPSR